MANYSRTVNLPGKTADAIYEVISTQIDKFLGKTPIGNYELNRDDAKKSLSFKSSMASGTLSASEGKVQLDVSLSFLATPFKGKIDEGIDKWIAKNFG